MNRTSNLRIGGHILADQLRIHGVELAFGVPGESYLALLDGLYDVPELRYVICRQEGGAAIMAEMLPNRADTATPPSDCVADNSRSGSRAAPRLERWQGLELPSDCEIVHKCVTANEGPCSA